MKPAWADEVWNPFILSSVTNYPFYCSGTKYVKPRIIVVSYGLDPFGFPESYQNMILKMFRFIRHRYRDQFILPVRHADRMYQFFRDNFRMPIPNLWLGVRVSNQEEADWRIPYLANTLCGKRAVLCDPLTRPVAIQRYARYLDWVTVKGDTGYYSCPLHPEWVRSLQRECEMASIPFFFDGWGDWLPEDQQDAYGRSWKHRRNLAVDLEHGGFVPPHLRRRGKDVYVARVGPLKAGRTLDGAQWSQYPEIRLRKTKPKKQAATTGPWWASWRTLSRRGVR